MANFYLDPVNGNDANNGTSTATPIKSLFAITSPKGLAAGDTIRVKKTGDPVRVTDLSGANINATFNNKSGTVTLSAAATATIHLCDSAWTADNGSTTSTSATVKQGTSSATITVTTTGQLRAHAACATPDLSGTQGISFWLQSSVAQSASVIRIDLCSDAAGTVIVNSFTVTDTLRAGQWHPIYINLGVALGSSIASVALTTLTGIAAGTLTIDNMFACNALNLQCMISKDSAAITDVATSDGWWPVRSIVGTTLIIDSGMTSGTSTTPRGYYGTTATVAIYARPMVLLAAAQLTAVSGTASSPINIVGGWDFTSNTQNGDTWWAGIQGSGTGLTLQHQHNRVTGIHLNGWTQCVLMQSNGTYYTGCLTNCGSSGYLQLTGATDQYISILATSNGAGFSCSAKRLSTGTLRVYSTIGIGGNIGPIAGWNITGAVAFSNNSNGGLLVNQGTDIVAASTSTFTFSDNVQSGLQLQLSHGIISTTITAQSNSVVGVQFTGSNIHVDRIVTSGNTTAGVFMTINGPCRATTGSCNLGETTKVSNSNVGNECIFTCQKYQDTAGDVRWIGGNGTVQSDTSVRHTASGYSWKMQPNANATADFPLIFPLQPVAVDNTSTVYSIYNYRSNVSTLNGGVLYRSCDLPGATAAQSALGSAAATTWQQISITVPAGSEATGGFTPYLFAYGDSSNPIYFDDDSAV